MRCLEREQALLGELASERVLQVMNDYYVEMLRHGQRLGAVRDDVPLELLTGVVRGLAVTYDRWFVLACRKPDFIGVESAARLFSDMARRLCAPEPR